MITLLSSIVAALSLAAQAAPTATTPPAAPAAAPAGAPGTPPASTPASATNPDGTPAEAAEAQPVAPDPAMSPDDFLRWVAAGDALQLELGSLAASRAISPEVRDLAKRMVTNHTAIEVIVRKHAAAKELALPTSPETADRAVVEQLQSLEGEAFDKAYMMFLADRTAWALTCFRWQYENSADEGVKPFAAGTTPIMGTHARLSEALNAKVNAEELRLAAERKEAERIAAAQKRAQEAADAAAAAQRKVNPKRSRSLGGQK
jgi:putative membrane protein